MGFQPFHVDMKTKRDDVPPPAMSTAVPAVFEALLDVFAPLDVGVQIDGAPFVFIERFDPLRRFGTMPLWCDEELTREPLTRCKPDLGADVIAELYDRLAGVTPRTLYVVAEGALRHCAAAGEPGWFGRWRLDRSLHELARVTFSWTAEAQRVFELYLPLSGYPLTSVRPLLQPQLGAGDPDVARQNRELLVPALCRVRDALGLDREEVTWSIDGHCEAHDRADLARRWLPALAAS